jgi:hypothetical protein
MIQVLWNKGYYDYVKPEILDDLIERREIISFRRKSGVVVLGVDPVRTRRNPQYSGVERRSATG